MIAGAALARCGPSDLPVTAFPAGSSDTSFNYAELGLQLALATVLWIATARVARRSEASGLLAVAFRDLTRRVGCCFGQCDDGGDGMR